MWRKALTQCGEILVEVGYGVRERWLGTRIDLEAEGADSKRLGCKQDRVRGEQQQRADIMPFYLSQCAPPEPRPGCIDG